MAAAATVRHLEIWFFYLFLILVLGPYLLALISYFCLPFGVPGIESSLMMCKASEPTHCMAL